MDVRRAGDGDVELVAGILEEAAAWQRSRGIEMWPAVVQRDRLAGQFRECELYLAWDGAEAVGTFSLWRADPRMWGERPPDALYLHGLAVRRSHAGLGREMLAWAERAAAVAGRRFLRLDCMAGNSDLRAYYERAGFRFQGTCHWPNGWESSLYEKEV